MFNSIENSQKKKIKESQEKLGISEEYDMERSFQSVFVFVLRVIILIESLWYMLVLIVFYFWFASPIQLDIPF